MTLSSPDTKPDETIRQAFQRMREELPELGNIFDAFEELLVQKALLKAELPELDLPNITFDDSLYTQGRPLMERSAFVVPEDLLRKTAERLIPAMEKGFPLIAEQVALIGKAIQTTEPLPKLFTSAPAAGLDEELFAAAAGMGVDPAVLKFVIVQLAKPFAEKRAESLNTPGEMPRWMKGYCPVCGSWPEFSFLEGTEGRRWLRCSFCGHEWTFSRTTCPFCESDDPTKLEILFSEDRPHERAELCQVCRKYLVSLDLRGIAREVIHELAPLGLVHLDVLAQEKEYSPGVASGWNRLG
jgi:FdhE protein